MADVIETEEYSEIHRLALRGVVHEINTKQFVLNLAVGVTLSACMLEAEAESFAESPIQPESKLKGG